MSTENESRDQRPGCLFAILRLFGIRSGSPRAAGGEEQRLPFRLRDDFLSPAEQSFYLVLSQILGGKAVVCPKVRLADLLFVVERGQNQSYANRIAQKHVDFVLCAPGTMQPIAAIELDDSSHNRRDRQERDRFVDQAFAAAALPLRHVPAQRQYNISELSELLATLLGAAPVLPRSPSRTAVGTVSSTLSCPKCGVVMVIKTATKGPNEGKQFYACPNFPKCRETRPVTAT